MGQFLIEQYRLAVSVTISGYEQFRPIGAGGFSTVYEARQPELNRLVAVKVLTIGADQDFDRAAFEGECRAIGTVSEHPNIVTVYESGFSIEGLPYITMERYNETLLDKIRASRFLPLEEVLVIGVQMAGALHRAHEDRLLHRDIKPQNIFFSQYGEPFLGDFGIAALAHEQHAQQSFGLTFHYAAPEVLDGETPKIESDIYSLGATIYTALAGHRPFARTGAKESDAVITNRIMSEPPPRITSQRIPDNIERELFALLAKHPNDRPRTALAAGKLFREIQVRLGHTPTPMRVATHQLDDDHTIPRSAVGSIPREIASPLKSDTGGQSKEAQHGQRFEAPASSVDDGLSSSVTVYRSPEAPRPTADFAKPEPGKRAWVGVVVFATIVLLGTAGFFITRATGDGLPEVTPTESTTTTVLLIGINPPDPVASVELSRDGELLVIEWPDAERATAYQVEFPAGGLATKRTTETTLSVSTAGADGVICVTIQSLDDTGRSAPKSTQTCEG